MNRFAPTNFLRLRREVLQTVAELLQQQVYAQETSEALVGALLRQQKRLVEQLEQLSSEYFNPSLRFLAERTQVQQTALKQLHHLTTRFAHQHTAAINDLLRRFQEQSRRLASSLIESDLLEQQRRVVEKMVLTVERVLAWDGFLEEILSELNEFLAAPLFFVLLREGEGCTLRLYPGVDLEVPDRALVQRRIAALCSENKEEGMQLFIRPLRRGDRKENDPVAWDRCVVHAFPIRDEHGNAIGQVGCLVEAQGRDAVALVVERLFLALLAGLIASSQTMAKALEEVEFYALHDPMTGLLNRRQFWHALELNCERSARYERVFAVLLINLDDFKDINLTYGVRAGDLVLREVAAMLQQSLRLDDEVYRIGGDEFAVLMPDAAQGPAMALAQRLAASLRERLFYHDGKSFHVTASVGVANFPTDGTSAEQLIQALEAALAEAKNRGKDEICHASMLTSDEARAAVLRSDAEHLREALRARRIIPYFQPIYELETHTVFGYEVLARLIEPSGEVISAGRFIAAIEKYGLSRELDRQILSAALKKIHALPAAKRPILFLNLSAPEIQNRNILSFARNLCQEWGIEPRQVVFELLERHAVTDLFVMRRFISELQSEGFRFALDDFGSGFNSLHYLRELAIDFVKIDGGYIKQVAHSKVDKALVQHLASLCAELNIQTIAEYVESREILQHVREMGISYGQGYFLGRPAADFVEHSDAQR